MKFCAVKVVLKTTVAGTHTFYFIITPRASTGVVLQNVRLQR